MNWESALVSHLKTVTALTAAVETRILPSNALQELVVPALVYQEDSVNPVQDRDSDVGLFLVALNLDIWSKTRHQADMLFHNLRDPLLQWTGDGAVSVSRIWLSDYKASFRYAVNEGDPLLWLHRSRWHFFYALSG